ncbi:MAG TPA: ABC transporter permease [Acidisoma sp.]|jgi:ribose transport system permease protein|nr:ABC transporter permease [Acidisoma sp.]
MSATGVIQAAKQRGAATRLLANGTANVAVVYILLFAILVVRQPETLTASGLTDLFNNALPLALAAAGGGLVVITRGFDLSVAGVIALTNVLVATSVPDGPLGALMAVGIACGTGLLVGAVNGWLVAYVRLQSIASTLATMIICSGIALLVLDAPGGEVPDAVVNGFTGVLPGNLPVAALIALIVVVLWLALRRTDWGVAIYAIGADETAAALAGVAVRRVKFLTYCLAGLLYGFAGLMLSALTATGNPNGGTSYLLLMFAAIAIGGTAFSGGRGGVVGSMIGAATLTLLQKVLFSAGVSSFYTGIFQGIVMILAVIIGAVTAKLAEARRR